MNKKVLLSVLCGFLFFAGSIFCDDIQNEVVVEDVDEFDFDEFDFPEPKKIETPSMSLMQQCWFLIKNPNITWYMVKQKAGEYKDSTVLHFEENGDTYILVGGSVLCAAAVCELLLLGFYAVTGELSGS